MPQVVSITHQNIVRQCRIPDSWQISAVSSDQRLVVVHRQAIEAAFAHAASEMQHEIGGYLTGYPAYDATRGISFVYVDKGVRGRYESSPTHVTLAAEGYVAAYALCQADQTFVVGWYHSHPRLTVFFSGTDHTNHRSNFAKPHEVAMVVDPAHGNIPSGATEAELVQALNRTNFAIFAWNEHADAIVRMTDSVVYVDAPPEIIEDVLSGTPIEPRDDAEARSPSRPDDISTADYPAQITQLVAAGLPVGEWKLVVALLAQPHTLDAVDSRDRSVTIDTTRHTAVGAIFADDDALVSGLEMCESAAQAWQMLDVVGYLTLEAPPATFQLTIISSVGDRQIVRSKALTARENGF
jgi:proteasome lid subunit RPN8/RPN11